MQLACAACGSAAAQGKTARESPSEVTAFTTPFRELDIASEMAGVVTKVLVEEGDHVAQGQALVELKSDLLRAQLEVSKAKIESADYEIAYYEATYQTRKMEFERAAQLLEKGVASPRGT